MYGCSYYKQKIHCKCENQYRLSSVRGDVAGMQGQVWGEMVRSGEHMFSQLLPRMLALAERAWHQAPWEGETDERQQQRQCHKDWQRFANTLGYKELRRLDRLSVPYYLPPPGAM